MDAVQTSANDRGEAIPNLARNRSRLGWESVRNQSGNRKTGRQEGRIGLAGKSPEAVLEDSDVEVYEESNRKASELEIGEHLSLMNGQEPLDRLHFDDEFILDDDVQAIAAMKPYALVSHRNRPLALKAEASQ